MEGQKTMKTNDAIKVSPFIYAIIEEIDREQRQRRDVYARQIEAGKLTKDDANARFARLEAAKMFLAGTFEKVAGLAIVVVFSQNVPITNAILECQRELRARHQHYPFFIQRRLLDHAEAGKRIALLTQAIEQLETLLPPKRGDDSRQTDLFA